MTQDRSRIPVNLAFLKARLAANPTSGETPPGLSPAGVLVPVFEKDGALHLLFTQRTHTVRNHQGQISFPGGVQDPGDPDLLATALRETEEEIGLDARAVEILGRLEATATITGYWINPFVALIPHPCDFRLNRREVERLLTFSLHDFFPPERWRSGLYTYKGRDITVCCWQLEKTVIWGATARITLDLLARLGIEPLDQTCRS